MKKLNRKGFTLIELLAVIVILAIVLVVTIPSVINTMNDARDRSLQNAADTVAEWFTKQYEIATLGSTLGTGTVDEKYSTFVGTDGLTTTAKNLDENVLVAAGVSKPGENIEIGNGSTVKLNGTKVCVELTAKSGGSFYATDRDNHKKSSSGCSSSTSSSGDSGDTNNNG